MYLRHFNENDYLELTKYYMPNLKEEQFKQIIREWNLLKYKNKFFTAQVARKNIASIKLHKKLEFEIYHEFISLKENRQLLFIKTL